MHSYHDGTDLGICTRALQYLLQPAELVAVELVVRCVIEINEIHSALDPVIVGAWARLVPVSLPLLFQRRRIKPLSKLREKLCARLGRSGFMIPDTHKKRHWCKRGKLVLDEIGPR